MNDIFFYGGIVLAISFFIASVVLFFTEKIPSVLRFYLRKDNKKVKKSAAKDIAVKDIINTETYNDATTVLEGDKTELLSVQDNSDTVLLDFGENKNIEK